MSDFDNLTSPPPAPGGEASQDQRTMALLAHILGIFTYFIGPLVIWLVNKDNADKGFIVDQAKEALNFQITVALAMFVSFLLMLVVIGFFLLGLVCLAALVLTIIAGIKANEGKAYRYPFCLRLIK